MEKFAEIIVDNLDQLITLSDYEKLRRKCIDKKMFTSCCLDEIDVRLQFKRKCTKKIILVIVQIFLKLI